MHGVTEEDNHRDSKGAPKVGTLHQKDVMIIREESPAGVVIVLNMLLECVHNNFAVTVVVQVTMLGTEHAQKEMTRRYGRHSVTTRDSG